MASNRIEEGIEIGSNIAEDSVDNIIKYVNNSVLVSSFQTICFILQYYTKCARKDIKQFIRSEINFSEYNITVFTVFDPVRGTVEIDP